jgi:hypothetical protein
MSEAEKSRSLPYTDTKPQGAADFYFAINSTFRFIIRHSGLQGWHRYLDAMAENYYRPVWMQWKERGLSAVAAYLREFFAAEPGAETVVEVFGDSIVLDVRVCPAIKHLREHGREIVPEFCQHCYFQGEGMASRAGMAMRLEGGDGSCRQTFYADPASVPAQDMEKIRRVDA